MRNKIIALVLTGMILMPTVSYAKGQNENPNAKSKAKVEAKVKNAKAKTTSKVKQKSVTKTKNTKAKENKTAIAQFKAQIKAKHEIMKANTKKLVELRKQINAKKEELSSILDAIKAGTKTLAPDQLELLISKADIVKENADEIKALPTVNSDVENTQKDINGKKFQAALSSLDKVIAKQEAKYAKLVQLNNSLDALLAIARQAQPVVNNTTPTTDNTSTTPSTTSSDTTTSTSTTTIAQ